MSIGLLAPPSQFADQSTFAVMNLSDDEDQCARCGMYYEDEFSTSTESDAGDDDPDASQLYAHYSNDPGLLGNVLFGDYMLAKQRWRRFAGRPPRRYRRGHFNKHHQRTNQQKLQRYGSSFASFLPPNAFAAHRGPGGKGNSKGKGKSKQNPRGKDGQLLRCHRCGSTEHLIRRCPQQESSSVNKSPNALAMLSSPSNPNAMMNPSSLQFYAKGFPLSMENIQAVGSSSGSGSAKRVSSVLDDLESLRNVTSSRRRTEMNQEIEEVTPVNASDHPRFPSPSEPAPTALELEERSHQTSSVTWTKFTTGTLTTNPSDTADAMLAGISFRSQTSVSRTDDVTAANAPLISKSRHAPTQKKMRESTTLQLSQLIQNLGGNSSPQQPRSQQDSLEYHPWWEVVESSRAGSNVVSYHSIRTCTRNGRVGLLVDPGAHDNLAGEFTMRKLENQLGTRARLKVMDHPLNVSGVGRESQQARHALGIDFALHGQSADGVPCSYTAPVIPESNLPPLLGLKSLQGKRAIEFRCSPGMQVLQLEMSESGHLLLPMKSLKAEAIGTSTAMGDDFNRLDFSVQCREARSLSPARSPASPSPGPFDNPSDGVIITGRKPTRASSRATSSMRNVEAERTAIAGAMHREAVRTSPEFNQPVTQNLKTK